MLKNHKHLKPVLKWWMIFCLVIFGTVYAQLSVDIFTKINDADITKLSFLIIGMFYAYMVVLGFRLSRFCKNVNNIFNTTKFVRILKHGWFISNIMSSIGFLGTIIGIINMLEITGLSSGTAVIEQTLVTSVHGMQTSLYTTGAALIGALIIISTLYLIENDIEIIEEDNDCELIKS